MNITFLTNIDQEAMEEVIEVTQENSEYFIKIADELLVQYTADLDSLMKDMYRDCVKREASDMELERYLFELNNMLYFLSSKIEIIGIKDDLSKMASKEAFNDAYLRNRLKDSEQRNKTTVSELTALAEDASRYETVLNSLYSRVYKQLKAKYDSGIDMVNSIRKIITKRMQDQNLSNQRQYNELPEGFTISN